VEEAADILRYYSDVYERNDGYLHPMDNLGTRPSTRAPSCGPSASSP